MSGFNFKLALRLLEAEVNSKGNRSSLTPLGLQELKSKLSELSKLKREVSELETEISLAIDKSLW